MSMSPIRLIAYLKAKGLYKGSTVSLRRLLPFGSPRNNKGSTDSLRRLFPFGSRRNKGIAARVSSPLAVPCNKKAPARRQHPGTLVGATLVANETGGWGGVERGVGGGWRRNGTVQVRPQARRGAGSASETSLPISQMVERGGAECQPRQASSSCNVDGNFPAAWSGGLDPMRGVPAPHTTV